MKKESVTGFIDRRIHTSLADGYSLDTIKNELSIKSRNMENAILSVVSKELFEELIDMQWFDDINKYSTTLPIDNTSSTRVRYTACFVKHSRKRISDLNWIEANKYKFKKMSETKLFNLVKLRDVLSPNDELTLSK